MFHQLIYLNSSAVSYQQHLIIQITFQFKLNRYEMIIHTDDTFSFGEERIKVSLMKNWKHQDDVNEEIYIFNNREEVFKQLKWNVHLLKELQTNPYFERHQVEWLLI